MLCMEGPSCLSRVFAVGLGWWVAVLASLFLRPPDIFFLFCQQILVNTTTTTKSRKHMQCLLCPRDCRLRVTLSSEVVLGWGVFCPFYR